MFYQGDLTSGISHAIQTQKLVACFITDPTESTSQAWESQYLLETVSACDGDVCFRPQSLGNAIGEKAVLLKIESGSKEAGFLAAFCPVEKAPMLVIIHNGQVLAKLESGLTEGEFAGKALNAVGLKLQDAPSAGSSTAPPQPSEAETPNAPLASAEGSHTLVDERLAQQPSQPQGQQRARTLLEERAQRLEADKAKREAAEKAERIARANARRKEAEEAAAAPGEKGKERATSEASEKERVRQNWVYQQKQRKEEAKRERERILGQIESDRQERKVRAQRAKGGEAQIHNGQSEMLRTNGAAATASSIENRNGACSLQVRLFDGTSIRSRFQPDATLATNVRDWIKETSPAGSGGADIPYNFRQILAPNPSRSIEVSEEHQSLREMDLVPNATLVLVPVTGATDAYASSNGGVFGYVNWATKSVVSLAGTVSQYLPSFSSVYLGGTADAQEQSNVEGAKMAGADSQPAEESTATGGASGIQKLRVNTLSDQRAEAERRQQAEFYNGNSLGFEGRKDDENEENRSRRK